MSELYDSPVSYFIVNYCIFVFARWLLSVDWMILLGHIEFVIDLCIWHVRSAQYTPKIVNMTELSIKQYIIHWICYYSIHKMYHAEQKPFLPPVCKMFCAKINVLLCSVIVFNDRIQHRLRVRQQQQCSCLLI